MTERVRDESGVTLIELLIAMVIVVIIMSVVGVAFIIAIKTNKQNGAALADSHDAQLLSAYLPADLQSAGFDGVNTAVTLPTGCFTPEITTNNVAQLTWSETVSGTTTKFVADYRVEESSSEFQLVRYFCTGANPAAVSPTRLVVGHGLQDPGVGGLPTLATVNGQLVMRVTDASGYSFAVGGNPRTGVSVSPTPSATLPPLLPLVQTVSAFDTDRDGLFDQIKAVFSNTIPGACSAAFSVTNVPSGGAYASATIAADTATLALTEGALPADTAIGSMRVAFAPGGSCAVTPFSDYTPVDKAAPVVTNVAFTQPAGGTAGLLQTADVLAVTFSEPVTGAPATTTVTELDVTAADTLTVTGVTANSLVLGDTTYMVTPQGNKSRAAYDAAVVMSGAASVAGSGTLLTLTVGAYSCSPNGQCTTPSTGGPGTFTFDPATTLKDAANNVAIKLGTAPVPTGSTRVF